MKALRLVFSLIGTLCPEETMFSSGFSVTLPDPEQEWR